MNTPLDELAGQAPAESEPTADTTEETVTQENELTAADVTTIAVVEGVTQHTIAAQNPTKEEMAELLEHLTVNYDATVDIKPVQFNFKKTKDKETGIETIRQAVQLPIPYPSVEGIVAILEAGGLQLELLQEAIEKVINDASRDLLYDDVTLSAASFPMDKVTWDAISKQPKAQRRGGGIAKEVWEAFAEDYVSIMPTITGKTVEQIANAAKILMGKLSQVKTNEPVLKLLVGQLAIRQAVQLPIPYPSVEGIVAILEAGGLQLELLQEAIEKVINDASRDLLYDDVTLSAASFPMDKVTWDAISKQPKAQRRGGGIAKEVWEAFAEDYVSIMPTITGKTVEQIANAAKILMGKLSQVKTNEPVLKLLVGQLAIYADSSPNVQEYQECVEFLLTKADTFLNVTDEQL